MTAAQEIIAAIHLSIKELRTHGRSPVRVRMHSLDAEVVLTAHFGSVDTRRQRLTKVLGLEVAYDDDIRIGEPVAEFDPVAA